MLAATPGKGGAIVHPRISQYSHNEGNRRYSGLQRSTKLKLDSDKSVDTISVSWQSLWQKTIDGKSSYRQTHEESRFREIERGTLVYSAWFDDRKVQSFIRVLLLTSTRDPLPSLFCHFETCAPKQNGVYTSRVSFYQNSGNHFMKFGCFIGSCLLPPELDCKPCFVNISTRPISNVLNKNTDSVVLPVGFIDHQHGTENVSRRQYGICIPPLHGEISFDRLIEFLELSQILGASYFTFYNLVACERIRRVLNYYEDKGLARVLPWNLPSYIGKYDIHYFGQTLSIMDCLFRSMSHLDFVAFNDLDEFIVPLQYENIITFLEKIHKQEYCGHCLDSVTFDPSKDDLPPSRLLVTQHVFHRTKKPTPFWNKCVVDPRKIFEQGIHHIVMPIEDNYVADKVNWSIARVFHYRKCHDTQALMHCSDFEEDKTMQKFGAQLKRNFRINRLLSGILMSANKDPGRKTSKRKA
ncbi:beta-1,4-galactosyltransferase galt-1-like [Orbicella faveolata]|uniref:beta-1,4-galactosyltransferase galt-1-like n=1 Tax=Orbicella faveolata TaxID=48498 RepID=UPI0009E237A0|nr:beta-1,4-galactosyltransferase galt-1-like [Orbicella faveolata]